METLPRSWAALLQKMISECIYNIYVVALSNTEIYLSVLVVNIDVLVFSSKHMTVVFCSFVTDDTKR